MHGTLFRKASFCNTEKGIFLFRPFFSKTEIGNFGIEDLNTLAMIIHLTSSTFRNYLKLITSTLFHFNVLGIPHTSKLCNNSIIWNNIGVHFMIEKLT